MVASGFSFHTSLSMRIALSMIVGLLLTGAAVAQDMPLHEILKPGESWQPLDKSVWPMVLELGPYEIVPGKRAMRRHRDVFPLPVEAPTCSVIALGGSTLLIGDAAGGYVWAFRIEKDGSIGPGDRYCRLKLRKNETRSETSAITVDGADRTYVAIKEGIQVFDPTGRLCGVFTAPPGGKVTALAFHGNVLRARCGENAFARKMLAEAPTK